MAKLGTIKPDDFSEEISAQRLKSSLWYAIITVLILSCFLVPFQDGNLSFMFSLMMWVTLATGINFIAGFTGYMPFGYVAFYGIGTYVTAILVKVLGVSEYLAVPAAGLSGILLALLFAPTLRLNGIFFAIVSLSLAVVCQRLMSFLRRRSYSQCSDTTVMPTCLKESLWAMD